MTLDATARLDSDRSLERQKHQRRAILGSYVITACVETLTSKRYTNGGYFAIDIAVRCLSGLQNKSVHAQQSQNQVHAQERKLFV